MTPTYASKNGVRYRYYVSSALFQGRQREAGSLRRIPAAEIETVIANAIRDRLQIETETGPDRELGCILISSRQISRKLIQALQRSLPWPATN